MTVYEDNGDHFHESNHDETDSTREAVEHLQPIFSSTGAKKKTDEETYRTDDP